VNALPKKKSEGKGINSEEHFLTVCCLKLSLHTQKRPLQNQNTP